MERLTRAFALALVSTTLIAAPALAQAPWPSDDAPPVFDRQERPMSKSDAHRLVGKVIAIDRASGVVKLQTDEGVVTAKPKPELLRAARVGDTISVPRPGNDTPSASPRSR